MSVALPALCTGPRWAHIQHVDTFGRGRSTGLLRLLHCVGHWGYSTYIFQLSLSNLRPESALVKLWAGDVRVTGGLPTDHSIEYVAETDRAGRVQSAG